VEALDRVRKVIAAYAGLDPPSWALQARIEERMLRTGVGSAEAYVDKASKDARELEALCEALRVGETRFFRQRTHVEALAEHVIPELGQRRADTRTVRAWSAGCASGEEAYTMAILLRERLPPGFTVRVTATDISATALARAAAGRYADAAVSDVPEDVRSRWLVRDVARNEWVVRPEIARSVEFSQQSLIGGPPYPRRVDLILCRNVLIYFDRVAREKTLDRLVDALAPGGYLLLGYAEYLRGRDEKMESVRVADCVVYRKREGLHSKPPTTTIKTRTRTRTPSLPPNTVPVTPVAPAIVSIDGVVPDGDAAAAKLRKVVGRPAILLLDGAEFLPDEAATAIRRAAQAGPLVVVAARPGVLRWIGRTQLGDDVRIAPDIVTARKLLEAPR
jgi:chemotaxis methyl-accepting protein methylase